MATKFGNRIASHLRRAQRRLSDVIVSTIVAAFLVAGTAAYAAQAGYLSEMPSAQRVLQQIRGSDERDTAAKQAAAFTWLIRMMNARIGRIDANLNRDSLSAPERQLLESYDAASGTVTNSILSKFDRNCQGPNCDTTKFRTLVFSYQESQALETEVGRFFSAQWFADYRRAAAALQASLDAQTRALANQGNPAQVQFQPPGRSWNEFMDEYFGYMVMGGLVALYLRRRSRKKAEARMASLARAEELLAPEAEARATSEAEMKRLGATKEARFARIEDLFNRKVETLSIDVTDKPQLNQVRLSGTIARPLASMQGREREVLRAAYHLFNIGLMSPIDFHLARLALVFGDGKAQAYKTSFQNLAGGYAINDFTSAMKQYTGMTSESAISSVLHALDYAASQQPNDPAVKLLKGRLLGGGTGVLSATEDFASAQDASKLAFVLGIAEDTGKLVTFNGAGSAITVAPPGAGKTQCHVFPTLLTWKGPAVVLDVKGEIYAGTSKWRSENVGPVYKFSPLDPAHSASWNPLTAVRSDPEYLWEDSRFLADMMLVPTGGKDPFWENRARDVLTAAIARVCLQPDASKRSFGDVLDVFHGVGWDKFIMSLQMAVDIRSMTRAGSSLKEMEPKTRDGVLQTGLSSLSAWDGDRIERATRKSDWSPLDLRSSKNPTIYICLKPNEVESYISVLRVFIAQHIRMLTAILPPTRESSPVLFLLDELPRLRHMPPVEEALEIGAAFGLRLWMFTQSLGQLEKAYPNAEGMVGSCALRMYMNPSLHDETAQKISDDIGMQEGVLDNTRQKIVEASVLAGPEYKDYVMVMASGFKPFRVRKNFAYADQTVKSRMGSL